MTKMIEGGCPVCDAKISVPLSNELPAFERMICSSCKQPYWLAHSVIDPMAYTEAGFLEVYNIDEVTKSISPRPTKLDEKAAERN
jgi:hypothetical protein